VDKMVLFVNIHNPVNYNGLKIVIRGETLRNTEKIQTRIIKIRSDFGVAVLIELRDKKL